MGFSVEICGPDVDGHLHCGQVHSRNGHVGQMVFTRPIQEFDPFAIAFTNPTVGAEMAQDVSFGAIPSIIHDGGDTANADSGTADTDTTDKLEETGQNFDTTVSVGMTVENTNDSTYARVSAVDSAIALSLSDIGDGSDIFPDGTDPHVINAVWTAVGDASWDFTTDISLTSGNHNDEASFEAVVGDYKTLSDFVALSFILTLGLYNAVNHDLTIKLHKDGIDVGVALNLNDYIDTTNFTAQTVIIPLGDFESAEAFVNGVHFVVQRSGGFKPSFDIDDLQLETGTAPLVFKVVAPTGKRYYVQRIRINISDDIAGTFADGTMPALSYNKILGVSALTNGISFQRVIAGETRFTIPIRQISDFFNIGMYPVATISDGTNTNIVLEVTFTQPIRLEGGEEATFMSLTVQDNLSGLISMVAIASGWTEDL